MEKYNQLLDKAFENGIKIKDKRCFDSDAKALIVNNLIGLSEELETTAEKKCVLSEELAHYELGGGCILDIENDINASRSEYRAMKKAVFDVIKPYDFIEAYKNGVKDQFELADFLNVPIDFLDEAIKIYRQTHGDFLKVGDYLICFNPLGICDSTFGKNEYLNNLTFP